MLGFFGTYERSIDAKGRLILPAKVRAQLEERAGGGAIAVYLSLGKNCIDLYSEGDWAERVERLKKIQTAKTMPYIRMLMANTERVAPDAQGRITLPSNLLRYAGIDLDGAREVVINGMLTRFELWRKAAWQEIAPNDQGAMLDAVSRGLEDEYGDGGGEL